MTTLYYPPPPDDEFHELVKSEAGTTSESRVALRVRLFRERLAAADQASIAREVYRQPQTAVSEDAVRHAILAMRADLATQPIRDHEVVRALNGIVAELMKIRLAIYGLILVAILSWIF